MTERDPRPNRPLEDSPEVAAAIEDDTAVPQLASDGGPRAENPEFVDPEDVQGDFPATEDLLGDPHGQGAGSAGDTRTGAEQPWDPEDLAAAQGRDPTPGNVERARQEIEQRGTAASVEKTVP
ncbi:hypothetical protein [Plantactinospora endophytica]|uniref:DUF5709 domain-containing protein n=1 Tax=Plantactinospora endophytica TaxID=673535 RepID=A0ABQ4EAX9_9ACTN|nr:hypothetical protein [Plantactinospora endophytica]GIG91806.1 hypothetical protein Pen02_67420 [Plantactinospora endophytica]